MNQFCKKICLVIVVFAKASNSNDLKAKKDCLRRIAIQCPRLWGATKDPAGDLSRITVIAGLPGVLDSCGALRCLEPFISVFDQCVSYQFNQDSRIKKLIPELSMDKYTITAAVVFKEAKQACSKEFK